MIENSDIKIDLSLHREPLVRHAVIEPWLACAANAHCISPVNQIKVQKCPPSLKGHIGVCMRADQSAISLILAKLFREKFHLAAIATHGFQSVDRNQKIDYFKELEVT